MINPPITRRGFTVGLLASLTPVAPLTAKAVEKRSAARQDPPLNQISELDALYLAPTAWEQSLNQTGTLTL